MRVRWFLLSPLSRTALVRAVDGMRREEFSADSTSGFIGERTRPSFTEGRYVERLEQVDQITDPFGQTQEFRRVEYQQTPFRLGTNAPQLEVYDGPRSVAPMVNRLTALIGGSCTVDSVGADTLKWLRKLESGLTQVCVTAAYVSHLSLSELARVRFVLNGTEDVRKYAKGLVGGKPFRFARLDVAANFEGNEIRFDLRQDGRATIPSQNENFLAFVRDSLSTCLEG